MLGFQKASSARTMFCIGCGAHGTDLDTGSCKEVASMDLLQEFNIVYVFVGAFVAFREFSSSVMAKNWQNWYAQPRRI